VSARVAAFNVTPVKGLALHHPDEIELTERGVAENRRFFFVDENGRLFGRTRFGPLVTVSVEYDGNGRLAFTFPDGRVAEGAVELADPHVTDFWGRPVPGRVVVGPWADAVSELARKKLRLVRADRPGDGVDVHAGTLVSRASCARLGQELRAEVDPRRFRMLLELDGLGPHEEDGWRGRFVRAGAAVLRVGGPVPRCAITTQDPETGLRTLDTLAGIKSYRGLRDGKALDFGVYFEVAEPGRVRVGDAVEPL
jgi:uncharacterized protein YcbX